MLKHKRALIAPFRIVQDKQNQSSNSNSTLEDIFVQRPKRMTSRSNSNKKITQEITKQYQANLTSKNKQIASLQSQIKVLNSTIVLLKQQMLNIVQTNKSSTKNIADYQQNLQQLTAQNKKLKQQLLQNQNQLSYYKEIIPKLTQLQDIQQDIMAENASIKEQNQIYRSLLKNISSMLIRDGAGSISKVINLICAYD